MRLVVMLFGIYLSGCGLLLPGLSDSYSKETIDRERDLVIRSEPSGARYSFGEHSGTTEGKVTLPYKQIREIRSYNYWLWALGTLIDLGIIGTVTYFVSEESGIGTGLGIGAGLAFVMPGLVTIDLAVGIMGGDVKVKNTPIGQKIDIHFSKEDHLDQTFTVDFPMRSSVDVRLQMTDEKKAKVEEEKRKEQERVTKIRMWEHQRRQEERKRSTEEKKKKKPEKDKELIEAITEFWRAKEKFEEMRYELNNRTVSSQRAEKYRELQAYVREVYQPSARKFQKVVSSYYSTYGGQELRDLLIESDLYDIFRLLQR